MPNWESQQKAKLVTCKTGFPHYFKPKVHERVQLETWRCKMLTDINKSIEKIHNYIYANDGLGNYEVLDELLKVFYIKTYDEQNGNLILLACSETDLLGRINKIFKELTKKYPTLFGDETKINLKPGTIVFIFKELMGVTISTLDSDVKGHLMQRIIDRSYREGRGQFFTPAQVVDFIVKMVNSLRNMNIYSLKCLHLEQMANLELQGILLK